MFVEMVDMMIEVGVVRWPLMSFDSNIVKWDRDSWVPLSRWMALEKEQLEEH